MNPATNVLGYVRRWIHTARLRHAYKATRENSRQIMEEWKDIDAENARKLDEMDGGWQD